MSQPTFPSQTSGNDDFVAQMARIVGAANVRLGADMQPHLTDWRGRYTGSARAAVLPKSTDEVAAIVRVCGAANVPIVPQGGNTGLVGGATPDQTGMSVVVCLTRMNRILDVDAVNSTMTVEAGCLLVDVQAAAAQNQRLFPLSLASEGSCTIGGNIATNAGGVHVVRYGMMRDQVLGLEVVLPDGGVWNGLRRLRKDNTGYDLKHLFIGSEGTLGIVTRAVLKLQPLPTAQATAWISADSPAAFVDVFCKLQSVFGPRLAAFELISRRVLDVLFKHFPDAIDPLPDAPWVALVQLEDSGTDTLLRHLLENGIAAEVGAGRIRDAVIAHSLEQAKRLWRLREHIPEAEKRDGISVKHDISLPISAIPAFLEAAQHLLCAQFSSVVILCFGHLGDGNLHYNVRFSDSEEHCALSNFQTCVNSAVYFLVSHFGGSISAEHGIGQLRLDALKQQISPIESVLKSRLKLAFDCQEIMNPGKLISAL